jgi:hypothetical protein
MTDMGEVTRAVSASLLFALVVWPSTGSTASSVPPAPGGCGSRKFHPPRLAE